MSPVVRGALLFAVGGLVVVACSGDDDAAPSSTTISSTMIAPTTSTSTSSTSTTSTSSTSTTSAPLTVEEEVIAAYQAAYDAFWAASQNPNDPELRRQLERAMTSTALDRATEVLDGYVLANRRVERSTTVDDGFDVLTISIDGRDSTLDVCTINPWVLVEDGNDGPIVVDDEVYVIRRSETMTIIDGSWRQSGSQAIEDLSVEGVCPA